MLQTFKNVHIEDPHSLIMYIILLSHVNLHSKFKAVVGFLVLVVSAFS